MPKAEREESIIAFTFDSNGVPECNECFNSIKDKLALMNFAQQIIGELQFQVMKEIHQTRKQNAA